MLSEYITFLFLIAFNYNLKKILVAIQGIGAKCYEDVQCKKVNPLSFCENSTCLCIRGYYSDEKNNCLKAAGTYKRFIRFTFLIKKIKDLGENCTSTKVCFRKFSECSEDKICTCKTNFVPYEKNCIPLAENFDSPCRFDIQCSKSLGPHAFCSEGICKCRDFHHLKRNECVKDSSKFI